MRLNIRLKYKLEYKIEKKGQFYLKNIRKYKPFEF